jgi:Fe2+ or Zn2+ uptake regulation protein
MLPKNYQFVYDILRAAGPGVHLTTADVFARAKRRRPGIGFSTVYRAIQRLSAEGLIDEIIVPGADSAFYEPAAPAHAHFRCTRCGNISDVQFTLRSQLVASLGRQMGGRIERTTVALHGLCRDCSA